MGKAPRPPPPPVGEESLRTRVVRFRQEGARAASEVAGVVPARHSPLGAGTAGGGRPPQRDGLVGGGPVRWRP